jgi:AhpC/TSA family
MKSNNNLGTVKRICAFALLGLLAWPALAQLPAGAKAPPFSLPDLEGKAVSLEQFKGRTVVLEWNNPKCPFVVKHYNSSNMPSLQAKYGKQVVWIAVNSTHPGHSDFMVPAQIKSWIAERKAQPTFYLLDPDGKVGQAYGAKTTPQMVVIDPTGTVRYHGAIDSIRSARVEDIAIARNYLSAALDELAAGKAVSLGNSTPYGCTVKYL